MDERRTSSRVRENEIRRNYERQAIILQRRKSYNNSLKLLFNHLNSTIDQDIILNHVSDFSIPLEWIKLRTSCIKNVSFSQERFKILKANYYASSCEIRRPTTMNHSDIPLCSCTQETGCGIDCTNRILYMECSQIYCKAIKSNDDSNSSTSRQCGCLNSVIQRNDFPKVEVFKTSSCGYGLRALENIPENRIIIEYLGEVITNDECHARMKEYNINDDFYFASLDNGLILDAKYMGSNARFANHRCNPTCELQKWNVLGESRIVLVSKRALSINDEITYNYKYFEDGLESCMKIVRQTCRCGSHNCCGTIGGRVLESEIDIWKNKVNSHLHSSRKRSLDSFEDLLKMKPKALTISTQEEDNMRSLIDQAKLIRTSLKAIDKSQLVDQDRICELLSSIPDCVRLEESAMWSSLLEKAQAADKLISKIQLKLANQCDSNNSLNSHHNRISWNEIAIAFNKVHESLPVRCDISLLVDLCDEISRWCSSGCLPLIGSTPNQPQQLNKQQSSEFTVDEVLMRYGANAPMLLSAWHSLDDRILLYHGEIDSTSCVYGKLHCYCQLPEGYGEVTKMLRCDDCARWFHPHCVNLSSQAFHNLSKSNQRFYCPACSFRRRLPSDITKSALVDGIGRTSTSTSVSKKRSREIDVPGTKAATNSLASEKTLESAIVNETRLRVSENPVLQILLKMAAFVEKWKGRVEAYLNQDRVKDFLSRVHKDNAAADLSMNVMQLLEDALQLYFDLTILRIKPRKELNDLRQVIWSVGACVLSDAAVLPDRNQLQSYYLGGKDVGFDDSSVLMASMQSSLRLVEEVLSTASSSVVIPERVSPLKAKVDAVLKSVDMASNYYFIRILCYDWKRVQIQSVKQIGADEEGHSESPNLFCWCRAEYDGSQMVCCDGCDVWYHLKCMGIKSMKQLHSKLAVSSLNESDGNSDTSPPSAHSEGENKFYCIPCCDERGVRYPFQWN